MIKLKSHNPVRDLFFGALLLLFIRSALHMEADRQKSLLAPQDAPFTVHEPDKEVIDTFAAAKQQIDRTITLAMQKNRPEVISELEGLRSTIKKIETRYSKNSPGLLFLGPFASISIVLKEQEIERKLAEILTKLNGTLSCMLGKDAQESYGVDQMDLCLKKNQQLLARFAISQPEQQSA